MASNDWRGAFRIAARFSRLGEDKKVIMRAHGCLVDPSFFVQLGFVPAEVVELGKKALEKKYGNVKQKECES